MNQGTISFDMLPSPSSVFFTVDPRYGKHSVLIGIDSEGQVLPFSPRLYLTEIGFGRCFDVCSVRSVLLNNFT